MELECQWTPQQAFPIHAAVLQLLHKAHSTSTLDIMHLPSAQHFLGLKITDHLGAANVGFLLPLDNCNFGEAEIFLSPLKCYLFRGRKRNDYAMQVIIVTNLKRINAHWYKILKWCCVLWENTESLETVLAPGRETWGRKMDFSLYTILESFLIFTNCMLYLFF